MYVRIFTISVIFLLLCQVYAMVVDVSCGDGQLRCCMEVRRIHERRKRPVLTCVAKGFVWTGECGWWAVPMLLRELHKWLRNILLLHAHGKCHHSIQQCGQSQFPTGLLLLQHDYVRLTAGLLVVLKRRTWRHFLDCRGRSNGLYHNIVLNAGYSPTL